ncbi:MAG: choice-of-anchor V domain-containing protein, partial [Acidobacteriota bacterium]
MLIKNKLFAFHISLLFSVLPVVMQAYETGPDPFRTGAPGDTGTCLGSGCHSGTLNSAAGSVKIVLPGGNTYTPGVKQHLMVRIVDSTRQKFGFELTARPASDIAGGQAGDFNNTDTLTQVICADGGSKPCAAKFATQFIEHTFAGYSASTTGGYTYQFDWTPPAT